MGSVSPLYATPTPTPSVIPIADGSGLLDEWVTSDMVNPMTTTGDLITAGSGGIPTRLGIGSLAQVLTVGSGGVALWATPSPGVSGANPTGTVGLAAVNGVATTYMRSDAAPALSQAITPNWTGAHVFLGNLTVGKVDPSGLTGAIQFTGKTSGTFTMTVNDAAGTWTAKWPATAGSNTNVLTTDGSGNLSWAAAGGGGSGTVNSGTATQFAYYPASAAAVSSTPTMTVSSTGRLTMTPTAVSTGNTPYLQIQMPTDTGLTAGTEAKGVVFLSATRTFASNTLVAAQSEYHFLAPTYAFASSGGIITSAATVYISGPPIAGTNASITNRYALSIGTGAILFGSGSALATINSTSGNLAFACANGVDMTYTTQSGSHVFTNNSSGTGGFYLNNTSGSAAMNYQISGSGKLILGVARATNNIVTGSAANDWAVQSVSNIVFSVDSGTSVCVKWVTSTGQCQMPKGIAATNTTSGTLVVTGGVGISGALFTGAAITTGTPSGGTSGAWKFGIRVAATVALDTTQYVQLDVGGTLFKLAIAV